MLVNELTLDDMAALQHYPEERPAPRQQTGQTLESFNEL